MLIENSATGRAYKTIDPAGRESRTFVDALGRTVKTVANYVTGVPSAAAPDCDVTVEYTHHASGQVETMTVVNPVTGNQVTRYLYGTQQTSISPIIYRNDLLTAEIYPDSVENPADGIADRVEYQYNRLGERVWKRDQNGTVHQYDYDNLGRMIHDKVTDVGTGVDTAVRRISTVYSINGLSNVGLLVYYILLYGITNERNMYSLKRKRLRVFMFNLLVGVYRI